MRFATIAALAFGMGAIAAPSLRRRDTDDEWCMTDAEATKVAENFKTLISAYTNASAEAYLCTSFTDYSDSVIELINNGCANGPIPLGSPTFTDRTSFEAGQGGQPNITFNILKTWNACDAVIIRWRTPNPGFVQPEQPVTGIIVAETVRATGPEPWLIETVYSEFNSGAWLVDLDIVKTNCSAPTTHSRRLL